jgi:hypothetical protein
MRIVFEDFMYFARGFFSIALAVGIASSLVQTQPSQQVKIRGTPVGLSETAEQHPFDPSKFNYSTDQLKQDPSAVRAVFVYFGKKTRAYFKTGYRVVILQWLFLSI